MAKLILSMDGLVLKEIPLVQSRTTIGRKPDNDIQIDNLAISGEHAAIVTILNDSFLEDLDSTNGTYVNGQPIKKHFLQPSDIIELGKYRLKYLVEPAARDAASDYEKPLDIAPEGQRAGAESTPGPSGSAPGSNGSRGNSAAEEAATAEEGTDSVFAVAAPVGALKVLNGVNAGRQVELTKTLTTLGKPGVQVAVITRRPQGYYLTHVEGGQFPTVNGKAIDAQACPLNELDVIDLAGVRMEFSLAG